MKGNFMFCGKGWFYVPSRLSFGGRTSAVSKYSAAVLGIQHRAYVVEAVSARVFSKVMQRETGSISDQSR